MTYPEMAATVLTSVAVLVTVLGVFIAILSVWGYSQIKENARGAARQLVEDQLNNGKLRKEIEEIVTKHVNKSLTDQKFLDLLEQRVDRLVYSNAQRRAVGRDRAQVPDENKEYGE